MSDRVSQFILLCEDEAQERLAKAFLRHCGHKAQEPYVRSRVASRMAFGGNIGWVMKDVSGQLYACRQRQAKASTLLIVLVDADKFEVEERRRELFNQVTANGLVECRANDPVVLLIPKRHVETWVRALLGEQVSEQEDCKPRKQFDKEQFRSAARALFEWSRPSGTPGATCVPSLHVALPEWKRIG